MTDLTQIISDIRKAMEKATPGEWQHGRLGDAKQTHVVDFGDPPSSPFIALHDGMPSSAVVRGWPASGVVHSDDGSASDNASYIGFRDSLMVFHVS